MLALIGRQGSVGSVTPAVGTLGVVFCALKIVHVLRLAQNSRCDTSSPRVFASSPLAHVTCVLEPRCALGVPDLDFK